MFKPSLTVHKSPKGVVKVLVCSESAGEAIDAYKACSEPGEVQLIQRGHFQKSKKVASKEQIAAKAKARENAAKARAAAELKQVSPPLVTHSTVFQSSTPGNPGQSANKAI